MSPVGTLYDVLGVTRLASAKEIRQAYRKIALKNHPDKKPGDKAAEATFKEATEAYETLGVPEKKAAYDRLLPTPIEEQKGQYLEKIREGRYSDVITDLENMNKKSQMYHWLSDKLVESLSSSKNTDVLSQISKNPKLSKKLREGAGLNLVSFLVSDKSAVETIMKDPNHLPSTRQSAGISLVNLLKKAGEYLELYSLILANATPLSVCDAAVNAILCGDMEKTAPLLVQIVNQERTNNRLLVWAKLSAQKSLDEFLEIALSVSSAPGNPESVRSDAASAVLIYATKQKELEPNVLVALQNLSKNNLILQGVKEKITIFYVQNRIKHFEAMADNDSLRDIAQDRFVPMNFRESAGRKAIDGYFMTGQLDKLEKIHSFPNSLSMRLNDAINIYPKVKALLDSKDYPQLLHLSAEYRNRDNFGILIGRMVVDDIASTSSQRLVERIALSKRLHSQVTDYAKAKLVEISIASSPTEGEIKKGRFTPPHGIPPLPFAKPKTTRS